MINIWCFSGDRLLERELFTRKEKFTTEDRAAIEGGTEAGRAKTIFGIKYNQFKTGNYYRNCNNLPNLLHLYF